MVRMNEVLLYYLNKLIHLHAWIDTQLNTCIKTYIFTFSICINKQT